MCVLFSWQGCSWSLKGERHLLVWLRLATAFWISWHPQEKRGIIFFMTAVEHGEMQNKKIHKCRVGKAEVGRPSQHRALRKSDEWRILIWARSRYTGLAQRRKTRCFTGGFGRAVQFVAAREWCWPESKCEKSEPALGAHHGWQTVWSQTLLFLF